MKVYKWLVLLTTFFKNILYIVHVGSCLHSLSLNNENCKILLNFKHNTTAGKSSHAITQCIHDNSVSSEMSGSSAKYNIYE